MLNFLSYYLVGVFAGLVILGCISASYCLTSRVTLAQGMVLFNTVGSASGQFMMALIWPLIVSYYLAYKVLLHYIIYMHNREVKKQAMTPQPIPVTSDMEEPTPVTNSNPFTTGLN